MNSFDFDQSHNISFDETTSGAILSILVTVNSCSVVFSQLSVTTALNVLPTSSASILGVKLIEYDWLVTFVSPSATTSSFSSTIFTFTDLQ